MSPPFAATDPTIGECDLLSEYALLLTPPGGVVAIAGAKVANRLVGGETGRRANRVLMVASGISVV
jgi:hypothetical protein